MNENPLHPNSTDKITFMSIVVNVLAALLIIFVLYTLAASPVALAQAIAITLIFILVAVVLFTTVRNNWR